MIFNNKNFLGTSKMIVVFFVSIFYFTNIHNAQAQMVVSDPLVGELSAIIAQSTTASSIASGALATETAAKDTWDIVSNNLLDYIAYSAGQKLLTQLTNNTLKWIQGGFHGSPSFEVDVEEAFKQIADDIAGNLVLKLRGIATCEFTTTYRDDLQNSVYKAPKKYDYIFDNQATCPFPQRANFTATEFYGETNKLTWDLYNAMLDDSGNPYGIQAITSRELEKKTADALAKKAQANSWSNGFADIKDMNDCTYPESIFATADSLGKDPQYLYLLPAEREAKANELNAQMVSDPDFVRKNKQYCKTTTPGKIVGDQLTKTLGVDMDRLGFADNMNKIISAFLDQVMQKAVRGVFGKGNKSYSTDPGGAGGGILGGAAACYVQVVTNPAEITPIGTRIKGSVTCADVASQANVSVWFRWSDTPFTGDSPQATLNYPSPDITHSGTIGSSEPFYFDIPSSLLTPGKTYYYSANAYTSNPATPSQIYGAVLNFTAPSSPAP